MNTFTAWVVLLASLCISGYFVQAGQDCRDYKIDMEFGNVTSYNKDIIESASIDLIEEDDTGRYLMDGVMNLAAEYPTDSLVDMAILELKDGDWQEQSKKEDVNVCDFLEKFITITTDIGKSGTFPKECPIPKMEIKVDKYFVDECIFPPVMARLSLRFHIVFKSKEDKSKLFEIYLQIKIRDNLASASK